MPRVKKTEEPAREESGKTVSKIPALEEPMVHAITERGDEYQVTRHRNTMIYYLYKINKDKTFTKIGKGSESPVPFDKIIWKE